MQRLNQALSAGLDAGLTINEIKEISVQLYAYTGFPRSLNALGNLMSVLKERKSKGIDDPQGSEPSPIKVDGSMLKTGTANQTKLVGRPVSGELYQFAPAIDQFLKTHLFGDIFSRDNLDWKTREIATISALAALGGVESQLKSHLNVGRHNGLTDQQLKEIIALVDENTEAVFSKGSKISNNNFTGSVSLQMLVEGDTTFNTSVGNVTFEPGSRSNWHSHPAGQILLITSGKGRYQEKGKPVKEMRKGDVIKCDPNITHWHGASPDEQMSHVAIGPNTQKGAVVWLQPVTDQEYNNFSE